MLRENKNSKEMILNNLRIWKYFRILIEKKISQTSFKILLTLENELGFLKQLTNSNCFDKKNEMFVLD